MYIRDGIFSATPKSSTEILKRWIFSPGNTSLGWFFQPPCFFFHFASFSMSSSSPASGPPGSDVS